MKLIDIVHLLNVTFLLTEIISDKEAGMTLLAGTNKRAFFWLNGELILDNYQECPLYYKQFGTPVNLRREKYAGMDHRSGWR